MTPEEAIARMRARWMHPPVDLRDIEERVALRLADRPALTFTVLRARNACRIFLRRVLDNGELTEPRSRYCHSVEEVDQTLNWILGRLEALGERPARRRREVAE